MSLQPSGLSRRRRVWKFAPSTRFFRTRGKTFSHEKRTPKRVRGVSLLSSFSSVLELQADSSNRQQGEHRISVDGQPAVDGIHRSRVPVVLSSQDRKSVV